MQKTAVISANELYRYQLTRVWDSSRPLVLYVMLNPSTADENADDPTVRRLIGFTREGGFGGFHVCNVYAYRTPSPDEMQKAKKRGIDINGPDCLKYLNESAALCDIVIIAWGNDGPDSGKFLNYCNAENRPLFCFGYTNSGKPLHPLYLPANTKFSPMNEAARRYIMPVKEAPPKIILKKGRVLFGG